MTAVVELTGDDLDLRQAGGKGINLAVLIRAGFPVPGGFVVTTTAYRRVVGDRLGDLLTELAVAGPEDAAAVARLAGQARTRIAGAPVPPDLCAEIEAAYAALGSDTPVAVRSSATAEDLESASFAGQQDTYLNVVGAPAVLRAVRDCWASLWTDRAVTYRTSAGVDQAGVALAVVVQEMVPAAVAGVMFTANPVTGTRTETVIDASPGLGEAVVSGAVNPDHFVIDTASGRIRQRWLGDKRVRVLALTGGGTERVESGPGEALPCLDDEQVRALAALGARVQAHYGAPQDTEWALDTAGVCWLTQARPITTLYPLIERPDRPGDRIFFCVSLAQGLTRPITPMGLATIRLAGSSVLAVVARPLPDPLSGPPALRVAGRRAFIDATAALRHPIGRTLMLAVLGVMESRAALVLRSLADDPRFRVEPGGRAAFVRAISRVLIRTGLPLRLLMGLLSPPAAYALIERNRRALSRRLRLRAGATPSDRLDLVERELGSETFLAMPRTIAYAGVGFAMLGLARRLLRGMVIPGELQTVLRGLPHNVTTEMDLALWGLAERIRSDPVAMAAPDPATSPAARRGLAAFLADYGHRAVAEIDLGMPRWSDDPSHLVGALRNYLELDDPALAPSALFAAGEAAAEAMIAELVGRARARNRLRGRVVAFALRRARQLAGLRESPKFLLIYQFALLRAQLQAVGRALVQAGSLDQPDDVFFVDLAQARRGVTGEPLQAVVTANRSAYEAELKRRHIPRILLSDGTEPEALLTPADLPEGTLAGAPASAGVVTAPARVVLDPVGARLEPGEILVAPSTDPGWTPLFLTAGGLVMEMGGANSHGAVVAREYGIPAVVGVADATERISTGQRITVDGGAGQVIPERASDATIPRASEAGARGGRSEERRHAFRLREE